MPMLNTYDEAIKAGEYEQKGAGGQVLDWLGNLPAQMDKEQERQLKKQEEQVKLYTDLRNAGYSAEEAHSRLTRTFAGTDFLQNFLSGNQDSAFKAPTDDVFARKTKKEELELQKTTAEIGKIGQEGKLLTAKAGYYEAGGPKRTVIDTMTPNQLQARLKELKKTKWMTAEEDERVEIGAEIDYINQKIQEKSGYKKAGQPGTAPTGKTVPMKKGGKTWNVPEENVEKAKLRGYTL